MSLATNKKAYFEYEILETLEAGIELKGTEVKSVRAGKINLKESHVRIMHNEVMLIGCHISPYEEGNQFNHEPRRVRKLLIHRKEIDKLSGKVQEKGLALMVTKIYIKGKRIKAELAVGRGKKLHDKRASLKEKDVNREIQRDMKYSD